MSGSTRRGNMRRGVLAASLAALTAFTAWGCKDEEGESLLCSSSQFNPEGGVVGDFGAGSAAAKIEAFLSASSALVIEVDDVETRLTAACTAIASDLGVPASELEPIDPSAPGARAQAACQRAAEEIRTTIQTNLPSQAQ